MYNKIGLQLIIHVTNNKTFMQKCVDKKKNNYILLKVLFVYSYKMTIKLKGLPYKNKFPKYNVALYDILL